MADFKVGKVTHYFDKIGVAVVELEDTLAMGDKIRIAGTKDEFTQTVNSMQVEHEPVQEAKKGMTVGMKVDKPVAVGSEIYKVA